MAGALCTLTILVSGVWPEVCVSFVPHFHGIIEVPGYWISYSALIGILAAAVSWDMTRPTLKSMDAGCARYWVAINHTLLGQVVEYLGPRIYVSFLTTLSVRPSVCVCVCCQELRWLMKNELAMMWKEVVGMVTKIFWAQEGGKKQETVNKIAHGEIRDLRSLTNIIREI